MKEVFKDINWYEWLYQVSNLWNIYNKKFERERKPQINWWWWYPCIMLRENNKHKKHFIHKLVLETFIWKSNLICNHIDWNKLNNNIKNLEYCTYWENLKHAYDKELRWSYFTWKFWKLNHNSKKINQYTLDWEPIKTWDSMMDIQREFWIFASNIHKCCNGKYKKSWWFIFKYDTNE